MKKIFLIPIIFLIICCALIADPCKITVRIPEGSIYPPFFMQDTNGKLTGLAIELAEALLYEAGCTPVYVPLPFARSLKYLESGQLNLMLNLSITEERKAYIKYIGPQLDETVVIVILKGSNYKINSLDDLKKFPKPIGVERGKVYGKTFDLKREKDYSFREKIDEVSDLLSNEKKLLSGRISCFLGYGYNIFYKMKSDPQYKNFSVHPFIINQDWVYFGFSKKSVSDDLFKRLQAAYQSAKRKGLFEAIRLRYSLR